MQDTITYILIALAVAIIIYRSYRSITSRRKSCKDCGKECDGHCDGCPLASEKKE